jgi:hypothetical protein
MEFTEFQEFKEAKEPEFRSQKPGGLGVIRVRRGAALTLAGRPDGISLYHVFRLGNARTGGSRELPRVML